MKRNLLTYVFLSVVACSSIQAKTLITVENITGKTILGINETTNYKVPTTEGVKAYLWKVPIGCRIIAGQGSGEISLATSFISQSSALKVIRSFNNETSDTLSLDLSICRPISIIQDHSIAPGETVTIGGNEYGKADIYYENTGNGDCPEITAHRVTVVPNQYMEMTKPYLQTATSNSVWICWKTSAAGSSEVIYGNSPATLTQTITGNAAKLSDSYYWHSVQLTNLTPSTLYSYKIKTGNKESDVFRFKTEPEKGSLKPLRILLMGDHQIKTRSGYEWLMQAAKRKIEEKYGKVEENINMIMNVGDQVDLGTLDQYEFIHLNKSALLSPYLPIMTAVGNHETYQDPGMANYAAHFHYEDLEYQGIKSGTENYYAYQVGRVLFVVLSTEHTSSEQKDWVRKVVDAVKTDDSVDFVISVNHRPIEAEQYVGDISSWVRNEIVPILSETPKHILNYGGHHHLYHRGQMTDYPLYHIINGAASWDQLWGMSSEKDMDDVQKTIDYWGYQILELDFNKKEMKADCYAIGNRDIVVDNILIDSFSRRLNQSAPEKPSIEQTESEITLPHTFKGNKYTTTTTYAINTVQYQIAQSQDFSTLVVDSVNDVEDLFSSTGKPLHIPFDINENKDITQISIGKDQLKNGAYYIRTRYRDNNLEWSDWSDIRSFTVTGSIDGDPGISITGKSFDLNQNITVDYQFVPEGQNAWIGIFRSESNPGGSTSDRWAYTTGSTGKFTFTISEPDQYYAVLFKDGGYTELSPRMPFFVGSLPQISIDKNVYNEGEPIKITYTNAPSLTNDWIGIYRMGETPGENGSYSSSWLYLNSGIATGSLSLNTGEGTAKTLSKGYYYINYFTKDGYFEPVARKFFSVGSEISSVSVDQANFAPGENIKINYANGPGTPKDWVGLFKEGKVVGTDQLDGFYYTYGATKGYISIPAGELPAADYFASLYINDSYDAVSNRIHITIGKVPSLTAKQEGKEIILTFEDNVAWRDSLASVLVDNKELTTSQFTMKPGQLTIAADELNTGEHTIQVIAHGWQNSVIKTSTSTGINSLTNKITVYPSPAKENIFIENNSNESGIVTLLTTLGSEVLTSKIIIGTNKLDVQALSRGTYILKISTANNIKSQIIILK
jgi:acid phosphatase type 7